MTAAAPESAVTSHRNGIVFGALAIGSAVAVGLGVYGRLHTPTGQAINLAGFSSGLAVKSALTTVAFAFGLVQIFTAMMMYGRIKLSGAWVGPAHRWSGRIAVAFTVPVAVHCLYALGFQTLNARVAAHSLLGCFFFGAFVAKMLVLSRNNTPSWAIPLLGGLVFTGLTGLWMTAALWYFANGA
jgi:hypothetical protein